MSKHAYLIAFTIKPTETSERIKDTHMIRAMDVREARRRFDRWFTHSDKYADTTVETSWIEKSDASDYVAWGTT